MRTALVLTAAAWSASLAMAGPVSYFDLQGGTPRYVTSDAPATHISPPGTAAFGINLDGVTPIDLFSTFGGGLCSGALISNRLVLTAAHCTDFDLNGVPDLLAADIYFETPSGVLGIPAIGLAVHLGWNGDFVFTGNDVALLYLGGTAPADAPRYPVNTGTNELGKKSVKAGYGMNGHGSTGASGFDGARRAGLNMYDFDGSVFFPGQLFYDFDSGLEENNFSGNLGYGADEVNSAPGDSGGPTFLRYNGRGLVIGITSWGLGGLRTDVDGYTNSSWGEVSADTRVSSHAAYIGAVADLVGETVEFQAVVVPEPSTLALGGAGLIVLAIRLRPKRYSKRDLNVPLERRACRCGLFCAIPCRGVAPCCGRAPARGGGPQPGAGFHVRHDVGYPGGVRRRRGDAP